MIGKTNSDWKATRAIHTGDFELVFVEQSNGVYVHYLKDSAQVLEVLNVYPEILENAKINLYEDEGFDGSVYFSNISLSELLEKLGLSEDDLVEIID